VQENWAPWDKSLSLIIRTKGELSATELTLRRQVALARRGGHSWAAIAFALGVTPQQAERRFGTPGGGAD
jgi:hypothetical protein